MNVFITGLTGTLGTALAKYHRDKGDQVYGCARDELRISQWYREHQPPPGVLIIGDASILHDDTSLMARTLWHCEKIYHCAAMKHVDLCEEHIEEALTQNVLLTDIVTRVSEDMNIPLVLVSTDKACLPQSVYGATKLLCEKIVLKSGGGVARLGNLIGSSGSVFHTWKDALSRNQPLRVTDPEMTRFFIPVEDAARFVAERTEPGYIAVPYMKSAKMGDIAEAFTRKFLGSSIVTTGTRPGETRHQLVIAPGDRILEDRDRFLISQENEGEVSRGYSSENSERWDISGLISAAGIS